MTADPTADPSPSAPALTEDDILEAALAGIDAPQPEDLEPQDMPEPSDLDDQDPPTPAELPLSPALQALEESRRPSVRTVCMTCPNSVWFTSPEEVKCYCRVMFLITWSSKKPQVITGCDGVFLGQEQG